MGVGTLPDALLRQAQILKLFGLRVRTRLTIAVRVDARMNFRASDNAYPDSSLRGFFFL